MNHLEALESLEEAMATMIMKVGMCEFYARIYEGGTESIQNSEAFRRRLFSALPEFHASVIVFSVKTREYFHATCELIIAIGSLPKTPLEAADDNHLSQLGIKKIQNVLKPFDIELGPFIADIDTKEKAIRECAHGATMVRIKGKEDYTQNSGLVYHCS